MIYKVHNQGHFDDVGVNNKCSFHMRFISHSKVCDVIIDEVIKLLRNMVVTNMVEKLELKTKPHPQLDSSPKPFKRFTL
jgi:hypothetical protein